MLEQIQLPRRVYAVSIEVHRGKQETGRRMGVPLLLHAELICHHLSTPCLCSLREIGRPGFPFLYPEKRSGNLAAAFLFRKAHIEKIRERIRKSTGLSRTWRNGIVGVPLLGEKVLRDIAVKIAEKGNMLAVMAHVKFTTYCCGINARRLEIK